MEDASHLLNYKRFFSVLLAVLPGLDLCYIVAACMLALIGDVLELDFGWAAGFGAIAFAGVLVSWIFIGPIIERWADNKSTGFLAGVTTPFIIVTLGGMLAFYFVIEGMREDRHLREMEEARAVREGRAMLVIEAPLLDRSV